MTELPFEWLGRLLGLSTERDPRASIYRRPAARKGHQGPACAPEPAPGPPVNLTALLRLEIDVYGTENYWRRCAILARDDHGGGRLLLDPPAPFRGSFRLVQVIDPNGGAVRLLLTWPDVRTCHDGVARTFVIDPRYYRPTREV